MSVVSNIQWNNLNSLRRYPIEDLASCISDAGDVLPNDIITDLNIWIPGATPSNDVFISSVSISQYLISLTISVYNGSTFTPIAYVTKGPSIVVNKNYALTPLLDGVYGWVSFGAATANYTTITNWAFSSLDQTKLLSRCVKVYPSTGVTSITGYNKSFKLYGDVKLTSQDSDKLSIEYIPSSDTRARYVDGQYRDAIVFRLNTDISGMDLYKSYIGPCDISPDSNTCTNPPILTVNNTVPDCDGIIHFNIEEVIDSSLGQLLTIDIEDNVVTFNFALGMVDMCARTKLNFNEAQIISDRCYNQCDPLEIITI